MEFSFLDFQNGKYQGDLNTRGVKYVANTLKASMSNFTPDKLIFVQPPRKFILNVFHFKNIWEIFQYSEGGHLLPIIRYCMFHCVEFCMVQLLIGTRTHHCVHQGIVQFITPMSANKSHDFYQWLGCEIATSHFPSYVSSRQKMKTASITAVLSVYDPYTKSNTKFKTFPFFNRR